MSTQLHRLHEEQGQSPWLDNIHRDLITSGELRDLIHQGIRGVTANPTIFERAMSGSAEYDSSIQEFAGTCLSPLQVLEELMIKDISAAADVFRPLYEESGGDDGYVSIEVPPGFAHDTDGTVAEARRFQERIGRPNVFVKVPATAAGLSAIRRLLIDGINVNITLLFSIDYYEQVMDTYLDALEERVRRGQRVDHLASVASFFVSRVDTEVDRRLRNLIEAEQDPLRRKQIAGLLGKAALANAKIAYQRFLHKFGSDRYRRLSEHGSRVQRPLWASLGTKNPAYRDVRYVEELIGPQTVATMPTQTIHAFLDHGRVECTIDRDLDDAHSTLEEIESLGISLQEVTDGLQREGVELFSRSVEELLLTISRKHAALQGSAVGY